MEKLDLSLLKTLNMISIKTLLLRIHLVVHK